MHLYFLFFIYLKKKFLFCTFTATLCNCFTGKECHKVLLCVIKCGDISCELGNVAFTLIFTFGIFVCKVNACGIIIHCGCYVFAIQTCIVLQQLL